MLHFHVPLLLPSLFLLLAPHVSAHGKVTVVTGNAGGNGTALGIIGGIVPNTGPNEETEVDTTVFKKQGTNPKTDGLGETTGGGKNRVEDLWIAMALSGGELPKVGSANGTGFIEGIWHVVVTDGAGPVKAIIDPTATGKFSQGFEAKVVLDVPGKNGNMNPDASLPRSLLMKRAKTVNRDYPMKIEVPADTQCTGEIGDKKGVCFMKIANENGAGPFGGIVAFQMVGGNAPKAGKRFRA